MRAVRLENVTVSQAFATVMEAIGRPGGGIMLQGSTRISIDVPQGTLLDLRNAVVRAHGRMSCVWRPAEVAAGDPPGFRYTLFIGSTGSAVALAVPRRSGWASLGNALVRIVSPRRWHSRHSLLP